MADGEPTGTGVETSTDVEFSVELKKAARVTGPRLETADSIISVGAQAEFVSALNQGLQIATTDMVKWLINDYQLEPWAAHQLIGAVGDWTHKGSGSYARPLENVREASRHDPTRRLPTKMEFCVRSNRCA